MKSITDPRLAESGDSPLHWVLGEAQSSSESVTPWTTEREASCHIFSSSVEGANSNVFLTSSRAEFVLGDSLTLGGAGHAKKEAAIVAASIIK
jgi:hypothetical protein